MKTPPVENLVEDWQRNTRILQRQADGITQAESLLAPPVAGNCMNWVLGHILDHRDAALEALGGARLLSPAQHGVYGHGSPALTDATTAVEVGELLQKLAQAGEQLVAGVQALPAAELERVVTFANNPRPLGGFLAFLDWHESYHVGQLELLRQLAGKVDKII